MKIYFDHEKLEAYKKSLAFAEWVQPVLERLPKSAAVYNQLDRARTSIVLNIPEGMGGLLRRTDANSLTSPGVLVWNVPVTLISFLSRSWLPNRNWSKARRC